jgi:S-adenosyl methyltransferase
LRKQPGGKDNFAADREAAAKLLAAVPGAATAARENRAFLHRAVRFLCQEAVIRQFLDIGAGLPTAATPGEMADLIGQAEQAARIPAPREERS